MLPVISRITSPQLTEQGILRAPYFEILLFKTRLKFRNPKRNLEESSSSFAAIGEDKRPFVNTVSRQHYLCEEEAGICCETIYSTGWKFYPKNSWFKPAVAALRLTVKVHGLLNSEHAQFPDLLQPDCASEWVILKCREHYQLQSEMMLVKSVSDFELVFNDAEWARNQAERKEYFIEQININGMPVFRSRPEPNQIDFYVAFSSKDMLQFSFVLTALELSNAAEKEQFIHKASAWVDSIMQSMEIDLKNPQLEHLE